VQHEHGETGLAAEVPEKKRCF